MRLFWFDGRFGWPLVIGIVFVTITLFVGDLVWRVVHMPFDTLLIYVVLADAAAAILLVAVYLSLVRGKRERR